MPYTGELQKFYGPNLRYSSPAQYQSRNYVYRPRYPQAQMQKPARPPFRGVCTVCRVVSHKGRDCQQLGERQVCFVCGTLDVMYPNCENCKLRRELRGNSRSEAGMNPSASDH